MGGTSRLRAAITPAARRSLGNGGFQVDEIPATDMGDVKPAVAESHLVKMADRLLPAGHRHVACPAFRQAE